MRGLSVLALLAVSACVAPRAAEVSMRAGTMVGQPMVPGVPTALGRAASQRHGNADLAQDFLDLSFRMESGRQLPVMTRFEGPITLRLTGAVPSSAPADLAQLIARLQAEAGLHIRTVAAPSPASITLEFLPRRTLARYAPAAACFVVPNVSSFADYRSRRKEGQTDWLTLTQRETAAIFLPADSSPQEVRDCLHEELAQAIGPLNDLYRLSDSVFNDDNFHAVLTPFDMMVLRIYYAPQLRNGMTEGQVAALLPGLLAALNPQGAGQPATVQGGPTAEWAAAVEASFAERGGPGRAVAGQRMLAIARSHGWTDARLGLAHYALGRALVGNDPEQAVQQLMQARGIYAALSGGDVHMAHVDMQLAAIALKTGQAQLAMTYAEQALPVARRSQNLSLAATLMLIRAEALSLLGRDDEAAAQRLDAVPLARYGFGSDVEIRARTGDISRLAPDGA